MRYLKLFLEHSEIPDYFIDLDSVGYVLDPNTGMMYAKWKKGGYDHENGYEVDFDDTIEGVSPEEELELSKWWRSCEDTVGNKINWQMINMAKDLSLDYLDEGLELSIQVLASKFSGEQKTQVYYEHFSHKSNSIKWYKYFPEKMKIVTDGLLQYKFMLREATSGKPVSRCQMYNDELWSQLSEIYKNETIIKP